MKNIQIYLSALLFTVSTFAFQSCDSDSDDSEDTPDTPESYILSSSTVASKSLSGKGTHDRPYIIKNACDFLRFIEDVNTGKLKVIDPDGVYGGVTSVTLAHDIEISDDYSWTPIGNTECPSNFEFNGGGHEISGAMNITKNHDPSGVNTTIAGLFGYAEYLNLSNLKVSADLTHNAPSKINLVIGTVAGIIDVNSSITDVEVTGSLTYVRKPGADKLVIGGVTGQSISSGHENCTMAGEIEFVGYSTSDRILSLSRIYIGGITGQAIESGHVNCTNRTDITLTKSSSLIMSIGGIAGAREARTATEDWRWDFDINENYGNITVNDIRRLGGDFSESQLCVGGLFGDWAQNGGSKNINHGSISVSNCALRTFAGGIAGRCDMGEAAGTNEGDIDNRAVGGYTGGCYGILEGSAKNLANYGNINSTITHHDPKDPYDQNGLVGGIAGRFLGTMDHCTNHGNISSPEPYLDTTMNERISYAGAIIGWGHELSSCYNYGTVNGTKYDSSMDFRILNGYLWLPWVKISNGEIKSDSQEYRYWEQDIQRCFPGIILDY